MNDEERTLMLKRKREKKIMKKFRREINEQSQYYFRHDLPIKPKTPHLRGKDDYKRKVVNGKLYFTKREQVYKIMEV